MAEQSPDISSPPNRHISAIGAVIWLLVMAAAYATVVTAFWNRGYIDFGDGNYIYISWRISEGQVLYRDIMAPQPPLHLMVGSLIYRFGAAVGDPLMAFRVFSLLLRVGTMLLVFFSTLRVAGGSSTIERGHARAAGVIAGAVYLFLPIGFWWSQGYQSEPLEMFFFMAAFLMFISFTTRRALLAGVLGALPVLTNMTAAPYALFNLGYLAVRRRRLLLPFAVPFVIIIVAVVIGMETWTNAYLENVILNQVGSYPRENPLGYAFGKIINEGADILHLEGGFVVLALLGIIAYARSGPVEIREYVSWYSFFALCSFIYVSKGGTMDYIFTIAEPFVAVFAALFLHDFWRCHVAKYFNDFRPRQLAPAAGVASIVLLMLALGAVGIRHSWRTLQQETYELDEFETGKIVEMIRANSKTYDLILGPPFYAVLAERRIAEDYSELFLWNLKYHNERDDGVEGRAVKTVRRIGEQLANKTIAFVIYDDALMSQIPEIRQPLEANYQPLRKELYRTLNTRLQFYVPKK